MKQGKYILLAFTSFLFSFSYSETIVDSLKKELSLDPHDTIKILILNKIGKEIGEISINSGIKYYDQALKLAQEKKYKYGVGITAFNKGNLYKKYRHRNQALTNYIKSLDIFRKLNNEDILAQCYYNVGEMYNFWEKYQTAIDHFNQALKIYNKLDNKKKIAETYLNLGNSYSGDKKIKEALEYYNKAYNFAQNINDTITIIYSLNNIGYQYSILNNDEEALKYYKMALDANKFISDPQGQAAALSNIGRIHLKLGNFKKALEYFNRGLVIARNNELDRFVVEDYRFASQAYEKMGIYKSALSLFKNYTELKDSMYTAEKHMQIEELEKKYEFEKKEKEIEILENKEKINEIRFIAIIIGLILFIVIGILFYSRQKSKIKKDKEIMAKNKQINDAQRKLVEAEKKEKLLLKEELNNKKNELTNFALHIIHKNDLLQEIKHCLKELKGQSEIENSTVYRDLIIKLNQNLKSNKELQEFQYHVEKVNSDFLEKIENKFPDLTDKEKGLAALLRLNLSSKEISSLNNVSIKAIEMGRYRLRQKLGLDTKENLCEFLQRL